MAKVSFDNVGSSEDNELYSVSNQVVLFRKRCARIVRHVCVVLHKSNSVPKARLNESELAEITPFF